MSINVDLLFSYLEKQNSLLFKQDGAEGSGGSVAVSTDPGVFTPTYGSNRKKEKPHFSSLSKFVEWLSLEKAGDGLCPPGFHRHKNYVNNICHPEKRKHRNIVAIGEEPEQRSKVAINETPDRVERARARYEKLKTAEEAKVAQEDFAGLLKKPTDFVKNLRRKVEAEVSQADARVLDALNAWKEVLALKNVADLQGNQALAEDLEKKQVSRFQLHKKEYAAARDYKKNLDLIDTELQERGEKEKRAPLIAGLSEVEKEIAESPAQPKRDWIDISGGINRVYKVRLDNGKEVVWKSKRGEHLEVLRNDIKPGNSHLREAAAYEVAKLMGIEKYVPITVVRELEDGVGSVQEFVPSRGFFNKYNDHFAGVGMNAKVSPEVMKDAALFDLVIGNEDRHEHNALLNHQTYEPILIDHGLAFPDAVVPYLPHSALVDSIPFVYYSSEGVKKPPLLKPEHVKLLQNLRDNKSKIEKKLEALLTPKQIEGVFGRIDILLDENRYTYHRSKKD